MARLQVEVGRRGFSPLPTTPPPQAIGCFPLVGVPGSLRPAFKTGAGSPAARGGRPGLCPLQLPHTGQPQHRTGTRLRPHPPCPVPVHAVSPCPTQSCGRAVFSGCGMPGVSPCREHSHLCRDDVSLLGSCMLSVSSFPRCGGLTSFPPCGLLPCLEAEAADGKGGCWT